MSTATRGRSSEYRVAHEFMSHGWSLLDLLEGDPA